MIRVSSKLANGHYVERYIYENEEEFAVTGLTCFQSQDVHKAKIGDYIKSNNGYYLPVINIYKFRKNTMRPVYYLRIVMPLNNQIATDYFADTDSVRYKYFNFYRTEQPKVQYSSARMRLVVIYMKLGLDLWTSYLAAYGVKKPTTTEEHIQVEAAIKNIVINEKFVELLKEYKVMNELKKELEDIGVDSAYIAKFMKDVLEDDKAKADMKKVVFTNLLNIVSEKTTVNTTPPTRAKALHLQNEFAYNTIHDKQYDEQVRVIEDGDLKNKLLQENN